MTPHDCIENVYESIDNVVSCKVQESFLAMNMNSGHKMGKRFWTLAVGTGTIPDTDYTIAEGKTLEVCLAKVRTVLNRKVEMTASQLFDLSMTEQEIYALVS